jgi:predicted HicB family RNase H-like nuclease
MPSKNTSPIAVRISDGLKSAVQQAAKAQGVSASSFIKDALKDALQKGQQK